LLVTREEKKNEAWIAYVERLGWLPFCPGGVLSHRKKEHTARYSKGASKLLMNPAT